MEMAQNGVRTRAQAALAMEEEEEATSSPAQTQTPKRRKINYNTTTKPEREFPHHKAQTPTAERPTSDDLPAASCCSSNGSVGNDEKTNDLEVESAQVETSTCNCGEQQEEEEETHRREMSHSSKNGGNSQEMESMEANSHRPSSTAAIRKPTESELDEFFSAHEKDIQQRFQDKYNFDIVKDVPLEGRYEWVQFKP